VKVIGTAGSTRYSYRDHVEIKPGLVHSQTYTAYQGSITNEVRYFLVDCLRLGAAPLSSLADAITAQTMIEAAEESIRNKSVVRLCEAAVRGLGFGPWRGCTPTAVG